jgi:phosphoglycerate kinase
MQIKSIESAGNIIGKRVLLRADFNVPLKNGKVADDYKIFKSLPTIKYLIKSKAAVIIVSHLGRPRGYDSKLSLKPVAKYLESLLGKKVHFISSKHPEKLLSEAATAVQAIKYGDVALLENIRFIKGEEENKKIVAKGLAQLADLFVLDGFAVSHREAASVSGVAKYLPAYSGILLEEEINGLSKLLIKPKRPFVVVLGGAKADTKIPVLKKLLPLADKILLGGGIANTWLWAKGFPAGSSLIDKERAKKVLLYARKKKVVMPVDMVAGYSDGKKAMVIKVDKHFKVPNKSMGLYDIGPETVRLYAKHIKEAQTLVWNGALGYFEQHPYEYGTYSIARLFAQRSKGKAFGVCGGGETVEVVRKLHLLKDIDLVSTGGGAMLEFLSGKKLLGVEAVKHKKSFFNIF